MAPGSSLLVRRRLSTELSRFRYSFVTNDGTHVLCESAAGQ